MRGIFLHIFILASICGCAQSSVHESELKIKGGFGTLIPHRSLMQHLHTGHAKSFEISYNFNTYGKNPFHSIYNYPQLGIAAGIYDLGNQKDIGLTYAFTPTISAPFSMNKYLPQLKLGIGLGIVSKPFGTNGSYRNIAIGSHLNAAVLLELEKSFQLFEKLKMYYSVSMIHFSNGASTLPNLGLNTITFNIGISYGLKKKKEIIVSEKQSFDKSIRFTPMIYGGWRENSIHKPTKHAIGVVSLEFSKQINQKGNWLFGVDFIYNSSVEHTDELEHLKDYTDYLKKDSNFQSGIFTGYGLCFKDIELLIQLGVYTYNQYKDRGMLYQRIGLRKIFNDKLVTNIGLKSHSAVAEYLEIGIGYRF